VIDQGKGDGALSSLLERYARLASPMLDRVVGRITGTFSRIPSRAGETAIGQLVADAHLSATAAAGARAAFVNAGGVRSSLEYQGDGSVTFGAVHAVYPFDNTLVTMTLTGAQIASLLEQQWQGAQPEILQVSRGFAYAWSAGRPVGQRVLPGSISLDGEPLERERSYRVTVNSFLANGGDGFSVLRQGRDAVVHGDGREALIRYFDRQVPVSPRREPRIRTAAPG
jgi:5'-nucleotidase